MGNEIRYGQTGFDFIIIFKTPSGSVIDISAASAKNIIFRKPSGTSTTKAASFVTDGHDGQIHWTTTTDTDLNEFGNWVMQGKVMIGGGYYKTDLINFTVAENLAEG